MPVETKIIVEISDRMTHIMVEGVSDKIVCSRWVAVGGETLNEVVESNVKNKYNLRIGKLTAEAIRLELESALPVASKTMDVRGRHLMKDVPQTIKLTDVEIREALAESVSVIIDSVRVMSETMPPELITAVKRGGILLKSENDFKNLARRLTAETGLQVRSRIRPKRRNVINFWSRWN